MVDTFIDEVYRVCDGEEYRLIAGGLGDATNAVWNAIIQVIVTNNPSLDVDASTLLRDQGTSSWWPDPPATIQAFGVRQFYLVV